MKFLFIIICALFFLPSYVSSEISDNKKILIFYKYDEMFFFGHNEVEIHFEDGSPYEIFSIKEISDNYKEIANEYLEKLSRFTESNIKLIIEFYNISKQNKADQRDKWDVYNDLQNKMNNELLSILPDGIRCMFAIEDIQYIEVAMKINDDLYANTLDLDLNIIDNVYWTPYLLGGQSTELPKEDVIDDQGVIKYREWFYESNMKLRIIKQIRDTDGKYYGEIYADYYKLDQYDKLFDKNGNPRNIQDNNKK